MTFSKLGTDTASGQLVYLPKSARLQGLYIIGMQRMGKSGLLENLIMQDIDQQIGVCVLDPHGELIEHVLARLDSQHEKEVIFLDIKEYHHPFGLNVFTCADLTNPLEVQKTVDQIMHIFEKLLGVSHDTPLILQYLRNCTYTLIANPGYTMADIPLLLTDKNCRQYLVANVQKPQVRAFWRDYDAMQPAEQRIERSSILRRVDDFLQDLILPIVGQAQTTIDFRRIMDERKILLVKLDRTLDAVTSLIGSIIVALILNASTSRQTQRQFHLYADEFQNFATEDFAVLLEQAAKWAIGVTMAHQNRSQLELNNKQADANLKARTLNVGNIVVFRVPTDADELAEQFDTTPPPAWEEELEEEQLEIREQERLEMMEVIDGEEEIDTPVKDVVGHLLRGGTHPNPVVNEFAQGFLHDLEISNKYEPVLTTLNRLLYDAMTHKPLWNTYPDRFFLGLMKGADIRDEYSLNLLDTCFTNISSADYQAFLAYWQTQSYAARESFYKVCREKIQEMLLYQLRAWLSTSVSIGLDVDYGKFPNIPDGNIDKLITEEMLQIVQNSLEQQRHIYKRVSDWVNLDLHKFHWQIVKSVDKNPANGKVYGHTGDPDRIVHYAHWIKAVPVPGYEHLTYAEADLEQAIDTLVEPAFSRLEECVTELKDVMAALAADPIYVGSGIRQPRKRQQILLHPEKTFPHPRVAITHPQPTGAEMETRIANQLRHLEKFSAWVKIAENIPQNPGKKCLKCGILNTYGDEYCYDCDTPLPAANEYIITTLQPPKCTQHLDQRIKRIQANNLRDGYVENRADVEAEILQRQQRCSGSPAAQPQTPQQQSPRHARQVPVQGTCPVCGFSHNPPGAKFCSICGRVL